MIKKPISINRFHKTLREEILKKLDVNDKISEEELNHKIIKNYPKEIYRLTITIGEKEINKVRDFIEREKNGSDSINNHINKNTKENDVKYGYEYENLKDNKLPNSSLSKNIIIELEIIKNNDKTLTIKMKIDNQNGVDVIITNIKIKKNIFKISPSQNNLKIILPSYAKRQFDLTTNYSGNRKYDNHSLTINFYDEKEKLITKYKQIELKDVLCELKEINNNEIQKKYISKQDISLTVLSIEEIKKCLNKQFNCNFIFL